MAQNGWFYLGSEEDPEERGRTRRRGVVPAFGREMAEGDEQVREGGAQEGGQGHRSLG